MAAFLFKVPLIRGFRGSDGCFPFQSPPDKGDLGGYRLLTAILLTTHNPQLTTHNPQLTTPKHSVSTNSVDRAAESGAVPIPPESSPAHQAQSANRIDPPKHPRFYSIIHRHPMPHPS